MGAEQPKPLTRVTKNMIDVAALKARIHLELIKDRKHADVIKGEKELIAKMKAKSRNRTEEILIAERVVNGLKYAQACQLLISYASSLRMQAHPIAENMMNPQKIEPFLPMIYSLIFAADQMGLSSLVEFKALMRALNDPMLVQKFVNPEIINALTPSPTPEELNIYILQFSERNNIPLEEINIAGHKFTREWKNIPSIQPNVPSNFTDIGGKKNDPNPYNGPGGFGGNNMGGFGNGGQGNNFNPYNNPDPKQFGNNGVNTPNSFTPPNNMPNNNQFVGNNANLGGNIPNSNPYQQSPANLGPAFFVVPDLTPKPKEMVKQSITSINDIDYYPEIDANPAMFNKGGFKDPDFDQICERLRKGL